MESLHINGHSMKFVDRNLRKHGPEISFGQKNYFPFSLECVSNQKSNEQPNRRSFHEVAEKSRKRKILKRPMRFKNYFTDRKPLSLPCLEFPRLGEQPPFRGRQTLCKYYDSNQLINEQLIEIKSATNIYDFENILRKQLRHNQGFSKRAQSIEQYYDTKTILAPELKTVAEKETCLHLRDDYRLKKSLKPQFQTNAVLGKTLSSSSSSSTANEIKGFTINKNSIDDFIRLATECYDKCIQCYFNQLNDCNQKVEIIERQSLSVLHNDKPSITLSSSYTKRNAIKIHQFEEILLTNQLNKLNINLDATRGTVSSSLPLSANLHRHAARRFFTSPGFSNSRNHRDMSCNGKKINNIDQTNQLNDPPIIILSDHSTTKQSTTQGESKSFSQSSSLTETNNLNLAIPTIHYCSESRPP